MPIASGARALVVEEVNFFSALLCKKPRRLVAPVCPDFYPEHRRSRCQLDGSAVIPLGEQGARAAAIPFNVGGPIPVVELVPRVVCDPENVPQVAVGTDVSLDFLLELADLFRGHGRFWHPRRLEHRPKHALPIAGHSADVHAVNHTRIGVHLFG